MVQKRPAAATRGTSKKQKLDPISQHCLYVSQGLEQAAEADAIPEVVSEMLARMLRGSLAVPKDVRHAYQESVVEMVCGALTTTEAALKQAVNDAQAAVDGGAEKKVEREAAVKEASEKLVACEADAKAKKVALAEVAAAFRKCKEAVTDAQSAQLLAESELKDANGKKGTLEGALENMVGPLAEGTVPEADIAGAVNRLKTTLKKFALVESLMTALPNALSKQPSARAAFDMMVVSQLNEEIGKLIASLDATVVQGDSVRQERAAALSSAKAALEEGKNGQLAAAQTFRDAAGALDAAKLGLKEAERQLKELGPESRQNQGALDEAQATLEVFQEGALASGRELRERPTPPPEPEPAPPAEVAGGEGAEAAPSGEAAAPAEAAEPAAAPAA